jgi:alpha-beta hydrolase superfamily lysophospholipase
VLALHGFTEHAGIFFTLGPHLAAAGFELVAYDQRGFGGSPERGRWAGQAAMVHDARTAYRLLRERQPERPVYLLGHSMGAAVATLAVTGDGAVRPAGTVLVAPALRSWDTLPWIQSTGLKLAAAVAPWARPNQSTGRAVANIQVTDDPTIRSLQARDAKILREVRFDMTAGVVDLMSAARARADQLPPATLALIAARDDMVPVRATCGVLQRWAGRSAPAPRVALYPEGYHFLMRDRQRGRTLADIAAWLDDARARLPSGQEHSAALAHARLCGRADTARARRRRGR